MTGAVSVFIQDVTVIRVVKHPPHLFHDNVILSLYQGSQSRKYCNLLFNIAIKAHLL